MKRTIALAALLAACTPAQDAAIQSYIAKGVLFCQVATGPEAGLVKILANAAGAPVTVINQGSTAVAAGCALIDAIPVSPPPNAPSVPVIATTTTLPKA